MKGTKAIPLRHLTDDVVITEGSYEGVTVQVLELQDMSVSMQIFILTGIGGAIPQQHDLPELIEKLVCHSGR